MCADYAKRAKAERYPAIDKVRDLIGIFLTCYIALVLSRVLQHKLDKKYYVGKIIESLGKCNCSNIYKNYYLFDYYDEILKDIGVVTNIDFSLKNRNLQEIKKS